MTLKLLARLSAIAVLFFAMAPAPAMAQDENVPAEYRKSLMQGFRHHQAALRTLLDGGVEYAGHVAQHASAIHGLAVMAGDAFPEGSGGEGSRALPAIWENQGGFMERVQALQSAAAQLDEAASSGDMDATMEAAGALGQTCRGCHTDFRARPSGP